MSYRSEEGAAGVDPEGIEPSSLDCDTSILPLKYEPSSGLRESNPPGSDWQSDASPLGQSRTLELLETSPQSESNRLLRFTKPVLLHLSFEGEVPAL
jgi:hypothetical protein